MTISSMRWLLGLDLRERCQGPLHFARWLVERTNGRASVAAVHVLEEDQLSLLAAAERESEALDLARRAVDDTIARAGASEVVRLNELRNGAPEEVLAEAAADMTGLLIGRQAPRGRDALVRLGRVARRLLRALPTAVVVTPPDLAQDEIGKGPVILATEADIHSDGAARFARAFSQAVSRPLLLAHVVPMPHGWSVGYLDATTVENVRRDLVASGERALERWAGEHGIDNRGAVVVDGVVTDELSKLARDHDACLLVVGSRKLSAVARLFVDSVGTELAARGRCPVAVVPDDYAP